MKQETIARMLIEGTAKEILNEEQTDLMESIIKDFEKMETYWMGKGYDVPSGVFAMAVAVYQVRLSEKVS